MIGKHQKPPGCRDCPLEHLGIGYVPGVGPDADIAFLAEAPGYDEVATGVPMVGAAGGMLTRILKRTWRTREQFRIENVLRCCPPGYEIKPAWAQQAADHCRQYSDPHLAKARVIVAMGGTAIRRLLNLWDFEIKELVNNFHGTVHELPSGQHVVCTFHPSYLQRGAHNLMGTVADDLAVADEVLAGTWQRDLIESIIDPPPDWFETYVDQYIDALGRDPWIDLALDVETPDKAKGRSEDELGEDDASMEILRWNVAVHNDEGVTIPDDPAYHSALLRLLAAAPVLDGWNFPYDHKRIRRWAQARGCRDSNPFRRDVEIRDGMWIWHHFRSDVPRGLGFAAPSCSRHGAWKHLFRSAPAEYASYDGPQTRRTVHGTIEGLIARGQWEVAHRHTVVLMQRVLHPAMEIGIAVDRPALDAFEEDLTVQAAALLERMQLMVPLVDRPLSGGNKDQGLTRSPEGPHPDATLFKRDGTEKKDAADRDPIKMDLYARHARVEEHRVARSVPCCSTCGAVEVHSKHRCQDKQLVPAVGLKLVTVTRWFWREPFNPDSPLQLLAYCKRKGHKPGRNKKTKADSMDKETLKRLRASTKDPLYGLELDYRAVAKVRGTYAIGVRKRLDADNRFHPVPTLKPSTLRTSYNSPNIQNVVADKGGEDSLATGFRRCVVARDGVPAWVTEEELRRWASTYVA